MKNMSTVDRAVRARVVLAAGAAYLLGVIGGPWAVGLGVVAFALLATSLSATCPAYMPFGISTRRRG